MFISQISVFVENRPGGLCEVTGVLAREHIDIRALSIADTTDFGVLRLIVNDTDKAVEALKNAGITTKKTPVIAARVSDKPGALNNILFLLKDLGVEYVYAFITRTVEDAYVVIRVENSDNAVAVLEQNGVKLLSGNDAIL